MQLPENLQLSGSSSSEKNKICPQNTYSTLFRLLPQPRKKYISDRLILYYQTFLNLNPFRFKVNDVNAGGNIRQFERDGIFTF